MIKNIDDVKSAIKIEVRDKIVGQFFLYKGQSRRILKFIRFWPQIGGFEFPEDFDLSAVPVEGPTKVDVKFVCWVIQEVDSNSSRQSQIDGYFGPVIISFIDGKYDVNTSEANFFRIVVN